MDGGPLVPVVELRGITKAFPGVVANDRVDMAVWAGEIHVLLGENGAGKSTLMHVLAGLCEPDDGVVLVDGRDVVITGPAGARQAGVGMVYQHPTLVPGFTVLENLMLAASGSVRLERKKALAGYARLAETLGLDPAPDAVTGDLPLGRQQQVEIAKVLYACVRVLILDEPTAMLAPQEIAQLRALLQALSTEGTAVVFITHKLAEAVALADRVTVLRAGRVAGRLGPQELGSLHPHVVRERIIGAMFGEEAAALTGLAEVMEPGEYPRAPRDLPDEPILRADGLSVKARREETGIRDVAFVVRRGEIFGVAGVEGNGQRELAEALAGQRPLSGGRLFFAGADITRAGVFERQQAGLRFVTDDRLGEGVVTSQPVSVNLLLKRVGERPFWSRTGRMMRAEVDIIADTLIEDFDIRAPSAHALCGSLSGGNIQKVMLGRELSFAPRLVVYNKPTQGLDAKTALHIRERIRDSAEHAGVAAVLISSDLEELLEMCDRIAVVFRGRVVGIVDNDGPDVARKVGELMLGVLPRGD